jgi:uncharacterized protein
MIILITGATGFLGRPLCGELLRGGHVVTAVSRDPSKASSLLPPGVQSIGWSESDLRAGVESADVIVNLAGESIAGSRWSPAVKERLRSSRVESTRKVVEAIRGAGQDDKVLVNASAVGFYGDQGSREVTEETPPGKGFLPDLCVQWESEARRAEEGGARVALARTGIVLGEGGGALEKMLPPFKLGVGGPLGSGDQWLPWVHRADVVRMFVWLVENREARGPFNVTSPEPVTMRGFARVLGKAVHRPALFPVPGFVLRAMLGEMAESLLTGQKALPRAAEKLGFTWSYPTLESALRNLLGERQNEE